MTLREQLDSDLKDAMRAKDTVKLSTIRALKSAMKYKEVEGDEKGAPLDDAGIVKLIGSEIKKRRDSVEQFRAGGRPELADKEELEIKHLQVYLPQQLSPAEIEAIVVDAIKESGATDAKGMGAVMKLVQTKVAGKAEGKVVSEIVKKKLSGG